MPRCRLTASCSNTTARAGGFEPLRFVPKGKTVVLGLVSTKSKELESQDDLLRRIEEASKYVPVEHLAISPQCGFATVSVGNPLTYDAIASFHRMGVF
jgi:5-methyltetrahydropteroyltriglutamate--homocysteine methyltransferase